MRPSKQEELTALVSLLADDLKGELQLRLIPLVPSVGVFLTLFFTAERAASLKLSSPAMAVARATLLQWEETHWALTQAVVELLEGIGVDEGSSLVEHLEMVGGVAHRRGMAMARQLVHRVVAMFLSHYPDLECELIKVGWAPGYEDHCYPKILAGCVELAGRVADSAVEDLGWLDDKHWLGENGLVALAVYHYK
jgi:hypothetical protein